MSPCCDGGCSKVNYAAYVKKNMPHNIYCIRLFLTYVSIKCCLINKKLEITLDGAKNMRHN